jgi:hypothetical protein
VRGKWRFAREVIPFGNYLSLPGKRRDCEDFARFLKGADPPIKSVGRFPLFSDRSLGVFLRFLKSANPAPNVRSWSLNVFDWSLDGIVRGLSILDWRLAFRRRFRNSRRWFSDCLDWVLNFLHWVVDFLDWFLDFFDWFVSFLDWFLNFFLDWLVVNFLEWFLAAFLERFCNSLYWFFNLLEWFLTAFLE